MASWKHQQNFVMGGVHVTPSGFLWKLPGDIIILHMCNKNQNHMRYSCWDMKWEGQNFLSFWAIFRHFNPPLTPKLKFGKNVKNRWRYYSFSNVYHKWRSYDVWITWLLSFWTISCPLTLLTTHTNKILKNWKEKHLDILSFFACLPQMTSYDVQFLSIGSWQT